ncbi:MAG: GspE/PulE family protein [Lachnospiraceae bacterium]
MSAMRRKKRLGDILISEHLLTQERLDELLEQQKASGKRLGEFLIEEGYVAEDDIAKALSNQLSLDMISLNGVTIQEDIIALVDGTLLRKHTMVPFEFKDNNPNMVRMAMSDPMDTVAMDSFSIITNLQVEPVVATAHDILLTIDKYYGDSEAMFAVQQYTKERAEQFAQEEEDIYGEDINNSPIVLLVKSMIEQAARQRASDIHIEALEEKVRIRYRIDGVLYEKSTYDAHLLSAIIARIKIISGMDISEKRKPQDGRITMMVDRKEYDIRSSILPTVFGEKCVMRLTQKRLLTKNKEELGLSGEELEKFDFLLKNPNGIILVTGPTGSGKSTTLYTALSQINKEGINVITIEDPVEANVDGVNQVQVNNKVELNFANALRSILRQDPDVIMIGEIRDIETAQIAVRASITGHLVLSTLHTNSAAATITRLVDMGVETYLLSDAIKGIIAQRLVRKLCPHCKKPHLATPKEQLLLEYTKEGEELYIYESKGCPMCNNTGYFGRIGLFEIMMVTQGLKQSIVSGATSDELQQMALSEGMHTIKKGAMELVLEGTTSLTEMLRICYENMEG